MLVDTSLAAFSASTAGKSSTPGGGSVVAAIGSLGAALGLMAARFTEGKAAFAEHAEELAAEIDALESLRGRLLELVDDDARAFEGVGAAYALPKGTPEEKAARRTAVQAALAASMDVPLRTCRAAVAGLEQLELLRAHCNPNLASDVAVGAYALGAAFRGAWVNVLVNLRLLDDEVLVARVNAEGDALAARAEDLEAVIGDAIVGDLQS